MSSFGALPIDARSVAFDAVIAASGKCIEGPPGMGFVIAKRDALEAAAGNCSSLALDLYDQWTYMERTTQWRYTPPTHVVVAFNAALDQFVAAGGQPARLDRYWRNCEALLSGMRALGFRSFLDASIQAPIIVTFHAPADPRYEFNAFYANVRERGFILYPGKLTQVETFRVGCIGAIGPEEMRQAVHAIADTLEAMGIREIMPAAPAAVRAA
jgi:2-aminoethylphosphonate-pyruvate transaminase